MGRRSVVGVMTPLEEFCARAQNAQGSHLLGHAGDFFGANSRQHPALGPRQNAPPWAAAVAARGEHAMRTRTGPFRPGPGEAAFGAAGMPIEHRAGVNFGGGGSRRLVVGGGTDAMPMRWNATQGWHHDAIGGASVMGCSGEPGTMGSIARFNQARYTAERRGLAGGVPNLVGGTELSLVGGTELSLVGGRRMVVGASSMTPAQVDDMVLMMQNALRATGIVRSARPGGSVAEQLVARQTGSASAATRLADIFSRSMRPSAKSDLERLLFLGPASAAAAQKIIAPKKAAAQTEESLALAQRALGFGSPGGGSAPSGGGQGSGVSFDANVDLNLPKPPPPPSASASFNVSGDRGKSHYMRLKKKRPL